MLTYQVSKHEQPWFVGKASQLLQEERTTLTARQAIAFFILLVPVVAVVMPCLRQHGHHTQSLLMASFSSWLSSLGWPPAGRLCLAF